MNIRRNSFSLPVLCIAVLLISDVRIAASNLPESSSTKSLAEESEISRTLKESTLTAEKSLRDAIKHAERDQPDWVSSPIKAELDKAISHVNSSYEFDYSASHKVLLLSFKTPLLDFLLVKSANELFEAGARWCDKRHVVCRSGNDSTMFLPVLSRNFTWLKGRLASAQVTHPSLQISRMQELFDHSITEFERGDTRMSDSYGWQLLKLAEKSDDCAITANILAWYNLFLQMMRYRPEQEIYKTESVYVDREGRCVPNDRDFVATLDRLQKERDTVALQELRSMFNEVVRRRRAGETRDIKNVYSKFVDLANQCDDKTFALPYFALNAYHAYLSTCYNEPKNYDELRTQLYAAWAAQEVGRQPMLVEANEKAGGDLKKLEIALEAMHKHSILVCRDLELCHLWGESGPLLLLRNNHNPAYIAMIYYQDPGNHKDLYLYCRALSEVNHFEECGQSLDESKRIAEELEKSLINAGFKPTTAPRTHIVHITGNWTLP